MSYKNGRNGNGEGVGSHPFRGVSRGPRTQARRQDFVKGGRTYKNCVTVYKIFLKGGRTSGVEISVKSCYMLAPSFNAFHTFGYKKSKFWSLLTL